MARTTYSVLDFSEEVATHKVNSAVLTAANFDAQNTLEGALQTALDNLIIGTLAQVVVGEVTDVSNTPPTNAFAQREIKLLVRYRGDTSQKIFTLEIPTPDLANLTFNGNTDFLELADASIMAAWVSAFEAYAVAPGTLTETVTVMSAQVVGRNI